MTIIPPKTLPRMIQKSLKLNPFEVEGLGNSVTLRFTLYEVNES
jgi:hypothetical protein